MATKDFTTKETLSIDGIPLEVDVSHLGNSDLYSSGGLTYSESLNQFSTRYDNIPVGVIRMWASNSTNATPPEHYLVCAGQSVSKTTYPKLFSVIGYRFGGSGDNFTLPRFNETTGSTNRIPSGVEFSGATPNQESNQLNNINSISISSGDVSHTHNTTTYSINSSSGGGSHSHNTGGVSSGSASHSHTDGDIANNGGGGVNMTTTPTHSHTDRGSKLKPYTPIFEGIGINSCNWKPKY